MSKLTDVYYQIYRYPDPNAPIPRMMYVAFKSFWDKNHCLYDDYLGPIEDALAKFKCYNLMESTFEVPNNFNDVQFIAHMRQYGFNMIKQTNLLGNHNRKE